MTKLNEKPKAAAGLTIKILGACLVVGMIMWLVAGITVWCYFTQGC